MSAQLALPFSRPLTFSVVDSPARTSAAPAEALGSTVPAPGSGGSSPASLKRRARAGSSSRTWPAGPDGGCLLCGEPSGHGDMTACPWASRPLRLALGTGESGCSLLLPTLLGADASRGTSSGTATQGGGNLREALLPTLCARDYRTGNASATTWDRPHARPLNETLGRLSPGKGCLLDPGWCEAFMGFPEGWTDPGSGQDGPPPAYEKPESGRSGTASSPRRSSRSDG